MLRFYHNQKNFGALVLRRKWQHRQNVIGENLICIGSSFVDQSQLTQAQVCFLKHKLSLILEISLHVCLGSPLLPGLKRYRWSDGIIMGQPR